MLVRPRRRDLLVRPQQYQGLNWDSPLAVGLQHFWPLDGRSLYNNLVTNQPLTPSAGHGYRFDGHPLLGHSIGVPVGGATSSVLTTGLANISAPWSFAFYWQRINSAGTAAGFTGDTSGNAYGIRGEQFGGSDAIGYSSLAGGNAFLTGIKAPEYQATGITYVQPASGNLEIYFDGILQGTLVGGPLTLGKLGNIQTTLDRPPFGQWGHFGVWNRALSISEVLLLAAPETRWDLLWTPTARAYFFLSAPTTLPEGQHLLDTPAPPPVRLRGFVDGGRLAVSTPPTAPVGADIFDLPRLSTPPRVGFVDGGRMVFVVPPPVGQQHDRLPERRIWRVGFVDGGRLAQGPLAPLPVGQQHDRLPERRVWRVGFVDGGRVLLTPAPTQPVGQQFDALPPRARGLRLITISSEPVTADVTTPVGAQEIARPRNASVWRPMDPQGLTALRLPPPPPPPVWWTLPRSATRTLYGFTQDALLARTVAPAAPAGASWTLLPAPRRLAPPLGVWPSPRVLLTPLPPAGRAVYVLPVVRVRTFVRDWVVGRPPSSLLPPPITFDCLHVALTEAWPRVVSLTLTTPEIALTEAWPRVIDVDGC